MSNPKEIMNRIEAIQYVLLWLEDQASDTKIPISDDSERVRTTLAFTLFQHTHITLYGVLVLLKSNVPSATFTLARPLFESYVRTVWTLECANTQKLNEIFDQNGTFPTLDTASNEVVRISQSHGPFIKLVKKKLSVLHSWTHGDLLHLVHFFDGSNIRPNYSILDQLDFLDSFVSPLLMLSGMELLERLCLKGTISDFAIVARNHNLLMPSTALAVVEAKFELD